MITTIIIINDSLRISFLGFTQHLQEFGASKTESSPTILVVQLYDHVFDLQCKNIRRMSCSITFYECLQHLYTQQISLYGLRGLAKIR